MISAPLPRCDSTSQIRHSDEPLGPTSASGGRSATRPASRSWWVRSDATMRPASGSVEPEDEVMGPA